VVGWGRALPDQAADCVEAAGLEGGAQPRQIVGISLESSFGAGKIRRADRPRRIGVAAPLSAAPRSLCRPPEFGRFGPGTPSGNISRPSRARFSIQRSAGRETAKIDVNPVGRGVGPVSAVVADDAHVRAAGKEALSPLGQRGVELDRRDLAGRADQLGRDRAIIARAGADMDDALAGLRAEGLDELGAQRRAGC
jgi:hypothetical protein